MKFTLSDALAMIDLATEIMQALKLSGQGGEVEIPPEKIKKLRISQSIIERWESLRED